MVDITRHLVHTIVLQPKLPQSSNEKDPATQPNHLVEFWQECLADFETIYHDVFSSHNALQAFARSTSALNSSRSGSHNIASALSELRIGDAFTVFVNEQNCGILFHHVDQTHIELELFEASADNASIMSSKSPLMRDYPGTALRFPTEFLLQSQVRDELSKTLEDLSIYAIELFQPHVSKAGKSVVEVRDSASPAAVTSALASVLLSYGTTVSVESTKKKIRDEVCWDSSFLPWRRPSIWTVLKVGTQRWLEKQNGCDKGRQIYKNLQAVLLAKLCLRVASDESLSDELFFVKAKLARRLDKLRSSNSLDKGVDDFACDALEKAHEALNTRWQEIIAANTRRIPRCEHAKLSDTKLLLRNCSSRIEKHLAPAPVPHFSLYTGPPDAQSRFQVPTGSTKLRVYDFPYGDHDRFVALYDFEKQVQSLVCGTSESSDACKEQLKAIHIMFARYSAASAELYASNIDLASVRMLTLMLLWMHMDRLTLRLVPLLQRLSPEIPPNFMRHLRLAAKNHLERVKEIEDHIEQRSGGGSNARYKPFTDSSMNDFACLFYDHESCGAPLRDVRARIDADTVQKIAAKRAEWDQKEQECRRYEQQAAEIDHEPRRKRGKLSLKCKASCGRCRLDNVIRRTTIQPFEEPLPRTEKLAKWMLFELLCPATILSWRDVTWRVLTDLGRPTLASEIPISCKLSLYPGLEKFHSRNAPRLQLVSSKKSFYMAHYGKPLRVAETSFDQVHLPHGPDYFLYDSTTGTAVSELQDKAPVLFWKYPGIVPEQGRYADSQASITHTGHTPNEVMSEQGKCPPLMSLFEFHSFNVLRSGESLQWLNMLVELSSPSLEFAEDATYRLVSQLALELGSATADSNVLRTTHQWFQDAQFCNKLLQLIRRHVKDIKSNWNEISHLRIILVLTLRLEEFALSIHETISNCQSVRSTIRTASLDWLRRIQEDIQKGPQLELEFALRKAQFSAALLCRATYTRTDGLDEWGPYFESGFVVANERPAVLVDAQARARHEILHDWELACKVESITIKASQSHPTSLTNAVSAVWPDGGSIRQWNSLGPPNRRWLWGLTEPSTGERAMQVHVNVLTGDLLVEGERPGRLPQKYLQHQQYRELFSARTFQTLPSAINGMKFSSSTIYGSLHFGWDEDGMKIGRKSPDDRIDILIPRASFGSRDCSAPQDLPNSLIAYHIHWLSVTGPDKGTIQICPLDRPFSPLQPGDWRLNFLKQRADRDSGQTALLEPNGAIVTRMIQMIGQFESRYNLVATLNGPAETAVSMPRFGLNMRVTPHGQLSCPDLNALLADVQEPTTFVGLRGQLLMAEATGTKFLVVPQGKLGLTQYQGHVKAVIDTGDTDMVIFSKFTINDCLGRLDCNAESRDMLYKAYLHAVCSGHAPDPLTSRRGTEEAIKVLEEFCRQIYRPLEAEIQVLLDDIAQLTPKRKFYPPNKTLMQQSVWNKDLATASQVDQFRDLTSTIVERSNSLASFEDGENPPLKMTQASKDHLHDRSRLRSSSFYPPRAKIIYSEEISSSPYVGRDLLRSSDETKRVYALSALIKAWTPEIKLPRNLGEIVGGDLTGFHCAFSSTSAASLFAIKVAPELGSFIELCRHAKRTSHQMRFLFLFPLLAFGRNNDMSVLKSILAIAFNNECRQIKPPEWHQYAKFQNWQRPTKETVEQVLLHSDKEPTGPTLDRGKDESLKQLNIRQQAADDRHQSLARSEAQQVAQQLLQQWPCPRPRNPGLELKRIRYEVAVPLFKSHWDRAWRNWRLSEYFSQISSIICDRREGISTDLPSLNLPIKPTRGCESMYTMADNTLGNILNAVELSGTTPIDWPEGQHPPAIVNGSQSFEESPELRELNDIVCSEKFKQQPVRAEFAHMLKDALEALRTRMNPSDKASVSFDGISEQIIHTETAEKLMHVNLSRLQNLAESHPRFRHLQLGGFWPRMTVADMLQLLAIRSEKPLQEGLEAALLELAVSVVKWQKLRRISRLHHEKNQVRLMEELTSRFHTWDLRRFKVWLILEIEMDVCIREEQAEMALSMAEPDSEANTIYQLQMGKGKSSLIIPMLAAILPRSSSLLRVVVPKPLLHQMGAILKQRVSRILHRPLLHIPFSRSTRKDQAGLDTFKALHSETLSASGVLLTLPEHMQSLQLSGLQCLLDRRPREGSFLVAMQQWLQQHCRDVLDECDHILSPRTQLIYPSGAQSLVDGGSKRWSAIADILECVFTNVNEYSKQNPDQVEVEEKHHSGAVPIIHFRTDDGSVAFTEHIVDLMTNPATSSIPFSRLEAEYWPSLRACIKNGRLSAALMQKIEAQFCDLDAVKRFLVMRGVLGGGILLLALQKRWNVSYGLHLDRCNIAVPYLARGRPSPASEFGHPDVAITLTFLAYYHQGLSQEQLHLAIEKLRLENDPSLEWDTWVRSGYHISGDHRSWHAVNLDDEALMIQIWRGLSHSRKAINYYLDRIVFPRAAREFEQKLVSSSWDLPLRKPQITTGFSGTNDNGKLMPASIVARDLPMQGHTNTEVLFHLLQPRNRQYELAADDSGKALSVEGLLDRVIKLRADVLLDAGALVLEMSNFEVATEWLKRKEAAKAAVYFNEHGMLSVVYRNAQMELLSKSRYASNLDGCLLYLDEEHCRGTDTKLPAKARAVLTIGPKQAKDQTVQAAMRLRQLAHEQSLVFLAPPVVDHSIRDFCGVRPNEELNSSHVISWSIEQSCTHIEAHLSLWKHQQRSFQTRKTQIDTVYASTGDSQIDAAERVPEREKRSLLELYGPRMLNNDLDITRVVELSGETDNILDRACAEEEQERQVDQEVQEEQQRQKPGPGKPCRHNLHRHVRDFILGGCKRAETLAYQLAFRHMAKTMTLSHLMKPSLSRLEREGRVLVTADFCRTVEVGELSAIDQSLRTVRFVAWTRKQPDHLMIISPYEAEHLMPDIKTSNHAHIILYEAPRTRAMIADFYELNYYGVPQLPSPGEIPRYLRQELFLYAGGSFFHYSDGERMRCYMCELNKLIDPRDKRRSSSDIGSAIAEIWGKWLQLRLHGMDSSLSPAGYLIQDKALNPTDRVFGG